MLDCTALLLLGAHASPRSAVHRANSVVRLMRLHTPDSRITPTRFNCTQTVCAPPIHIEIPFSSRQVYLIHSFGIGSAFSSCNRETYDNSITTSRPAHVYSLTVYTRLANFATHSLPAADHADAPISGASCSLGRSIVLLSSGSSLPSYISQFPPRYKRAHSSVTVDNANVSP